MRPMPGGNDDGVTMLRAINEGIAALNRNVQTGLAALVNPELNSAFVDGAQSISGASQVTIPIPDGIAYFELFIWACSPATDGANLLMRGVQGGSVLSGASDYSWANLKATTHTNDGADAQMVVGAGLDLTLGSTLKVNILRPKALNKRKFATWEGLMMDSAASLPQTWSGGGRFEATAFNTGTIDGIQFLFSAGNINSFEYAIRYNSFTAT